MIKTGLKKTSELRHPYKRCISHVNGVIITLATLCFTIKMKEGEKNHFLSSPEVSLSICHALIRCRT